MVDVNEVAGKAACDELKKTYGANEVIYARCDVTDKTELVSCFYSCHVQSVIYIS